MVFDLRQIAVECHEDLEVLRQNRLLSESDFIAFSRGRGLPVFGTVQGDPGDFNTRGWLVNDGIDCDGGLLFHPFRIYPLHRILKSCVLPIATSQTLLPDATLNQVKASLARMPSNDEIEASSRQWNEIADLAILLEPIFWPGIVQRISRSSLEFCIFTSSF